MTDELDGLKQRLVGAVVILSLAIIFLPMVFDKPHQEAASRIVPVPPAPETKKLTIEKPKKPSYEVVELDPSDKRVKPVSQIKKPAPVPAKASDKKEATKPRLNLASPSKNATPRVSNLPAFKNIWLVQLGTFSQTKNAYALRDRLRKDGFDGHIKEIVRKDKKVLQVFTGPFVNKKEAHRTKVKLDSKYKLKSLLVYIDK